MPFQLGTDAIRRTLGYLKRGKLVFKDNVRVLAVHYNDKGDYHQGARDFVHWNLCQIQYKNPNVQIAELKNNFPSPFIRCWLDNGSDVIMDVFGKSNVEILNQIIKVLGKPKQELDIAAETASKEKTISKFGSGYLRHCICEIPGQVPCPKICALPEQMTARYKMENNAYPKSWLDDTP